MANNLSTVSLQVSFAEETSSDGNIVLEQLTQRFDFNGRLWLRCFPSIGVTYVASVGKVIEDHEFSGDFYEAIKFSNSSSVALGKPNAYSVVINPLNNILMQQIETTSGKIIEPASGISISFDSASNSIITTDSLGERRAVYGACLVAYKAMYRFLYYIPAVEAPFGGVYGMNFGVGPVYAYNNQTVEVLDITLDLKSSPDRVEFARVTSKIVLDARGTWEFPDNWNTTYTSNRGKSPEAKADYSSPGTFNTGSDEIDPDACFVDTRVNMIIYIDTTGSLFYEDFNNGGDGYWAWFNPYFGDSTYDPKYECTWSSPPGGEKASSAEDFKYDLYHKTWRDVFLMVDKGALLERLEKEYPGVTAGNKVRQ